MDFKLNLHALLEPYRREIEATLKPCIRIITNPGKTLHWKSKFGGNPYLPLHLHKGNHDTKHYKKHFHNSAPYPVNTSNGLPLYFLGQINFEELPAIHPFPRKGIVQFFADMKSKDYGMGNGIHQKGFRILYHPEILENKKQLVNDYSFLPQTWKDKEHSLQFFSTHEPVSTNDSNYQKLYSSDLRQLLSDNNLAMDAYQKLLSGGDYNYNKIGGYHDSINGFYPVYSNAEVDKIILLIQFDGCDVFSWGDAGTANFFIKEKDLMNLNFSNVIYHWDD